MKRTAPVKKGSVLTLPVTDLGIHGEGIGRIDGFTVFVPGGLPGEQVSAEITQVKPSYAIGTLREILQTSRERVTPLCPAFGRCGGCQISHLSYEGQLAAKHKRVRDVIRRIGGIDRDVVRPVIPAASPYGYRNKMAAPAAKKDGKSCLGFYRQGSHELIPLSCCPIQNKENNALLARVSDFLRTHELPIYDEASGKGSLRHVVARTGKDGMLMVVLVTAAESLPCEQEWIAALRSLPFVKSIYHNVQKRKGNVILGDKIRLLWGEKTIIASLMGLTFDISPYSFFQVHGAQAEILYETALAFADLSGGETVIDAYCGTGTISLCLARQAKKVIGLDIVKPAIDDAWKNAKRNGMKNVAFYAGDAGKLMPGLYKEGLAPEVIVMDPVRAGAGEAVLQAAAGMKPKRIVYVSCNPATFARDAKYLEQAGYRLEQVQPVDMFPQTMHIETVSLLVREKRNKNPA
ncbi:MAG: 23S rRNA (uracil(1939)-C(5))-methyltransferase RlmD [Dialister sp.]|nr:23S rRNA (uracil(1939)-C(5))-methyltransferase RlmD [Dialister sp.]